MDDEYILDEEALRRALEDLREFRPLFYENPAAAKLWIEHFLEKRDWKYDPNTESFQDLWNAYRREVGKL